MKSAVETKNVIFNNLTLNFMKKLNRLQIKPERIMKNDELITLKGGYDWEHIGCCICYDHDMNPMGGIASFDRDDCSMNCYDAGGWLGWYLC